jgi:hypothetical protein
MSEQLQHRMQTFEVAPPAMVWESIAVRLDDDSQHANLSKRIHSFEITPPATAWSNIADLLYSDNKQSVNIPDAKVRNISTSRNWYKMAAAAIVTALLLGGGWYFANQNKQIDIASVKETNATPPVVINPEKENNTFVENSSKQPVPDIAIAPANKKTTINNIIVANNNDINKADKASKKISDYNPEKDYVLTYAKVNRPPSYFEQPVIINGPILRDENGLPYRDIGVLTNEGRYLVVAGPNGQMTRISAKFASVIQFINGSDDQVEENLDKVLRESGIWKQRFQEWRNKIKKAGYLPAPGNFLDILEFKALIEEK